MSNSALLAWVLVGFVSAAAFHLSAGLVHHRYQQIAPPQSADRNGHIHHRRPPSIWASLGRGPFVNVWGSVPLPGGFRLGHSLTRW